MPRTRSTICLVKVAKQGGEVKEYNLNGGEHTVAEALRLAGVTANDNTAVRINGREAQLSDEVKNNDIITMASNVKGGSK